MKMSGVLSHFIDSFRKPKSLTDYPPGEAVRAAFAFTVSIFVIVSIVVGISRVIQTGDISQTSGMDTTLLAVLYTANFGIYILLFLLGVAISSMFTSNKFEPIKVAVPFFIFNALYLLFVPVVFLLAWLTRTTDDDIHPIYLSALILIFNIGLFAYVAYYLKAVFEYPIASSLLGILSTFFGMVSLYFLLTQLPAFERFMNVSMGPEHASEYISDITVFRHDMNGRTARVNMIGQDNFGREIVISQDTYHENRHFYKETNNPLHDVLYQYGRYDFFADDEGDLQICYFYSPYQIAKLEYEKNGKVPVSVPNSWVHQNFDTSNGHCFYPKFFDDQIYGLEFKNDPDKIFILEDKRNNDVKRMKSIFTFVD